MTDRAENNNILSLGNLVIGYGARGLLPPLNATAANSEMVAVIGRNGIGKSTLLRTIAGIQKRVNGDIFISGKELHDHSASELARSAGYLSTEIIRAGHMTVSELVALGRYPHTNWLGTLNHADMEVIENALHATGLTSYRNRFVNEISDGERQKAMIARILAQDTSLMIMDEPTAFLDIPSKYEILYLLHKLTRESGKTIIMSTHDLHLALTQSDSIWLITDEHLRQDTPEDLVLSGALGNLFETPHVRFEPVSGNFVFHGDDGKGIFVSGSGIARQWTENALRRNGFVISDSMTDPYIEILHTNKTSWKIIHGNSHDMYDSINQLIIKLKSGK